MSSCSSDSSDSSDWTAPEYAKAALLTIDVQNDTLDGQPFEIRGTSQALPTIGEIASVFRQLARPIVHVLRIYLPDGSNAELCRRNELNNGAQMFLAGSTGRQVAQLILPDDAPSPDDESLLRGEFQPLGTAEWYMHKSRWGAFFNTALEQHLKNLGVSTIVVAGCNYPNCIRATVYEASERDFRVVTIKDAISNFSTNGWAELRAIGVNVVSAAECVRELKSLNGTVIVEN